MPASKSNIPPSLVWTPEALASTKQRVGLLVSLFPKDRCRELVQATLNEIDAQLAVEDPVILPDFDEAETEDLESKDIPEEARQQVNALAALAGKRFSELPQPSFEENTARIDEEAGAAAYHIVVSWLQGLHYARSQSENKPVRLDELLSPPRELAREGADWEDFLAASFALTGDRIRELMALYVAKLIPYFESEMVLHPEGVVLSEDDLIICKDEKGFYLPPKPQE